MSIDQLKGQRPIRVKWRAFPLHPDTPREGLSLKALFAQKGILADVSRVMAELKKTAATFGLPLGEREMTYNSRLAQELGLWAETQGAEDRFHDSAFRAYFAEGRNLADKTVLLDLIRHVGLDPNEGAHVLGHRLFKDAVDQEWRLAKTLEITAVPTLVMGGERLVGAQPYAMLERFVDQHLP